MLHSGVGVGNGGGCAFVAAGLYIGILCTFLSTLQNCSKNCLLKIIRKPSPRKVKRLAWGQTRIEDSGITESRAPSVPNCLPTLLPIKASTQRGKAYGRKAGTAAEMAGNLDHSSPIPSESRCVLRAGAGRSMCRRICVFQTFSFFFFF